MKILQISLFTVIFTLVANAYAVEENNIDVTFLNNSPKMLRCGIKGHVDYTPFIRLHPENSKRFQDFKRGSEVRCQTEISDRSSTMLTYFSVTEAGTYELLQENVPCRTCTASKVRLATIVTFPNGEASYSFENE